MVQFFTFHLGYGITQSFLVSADTEGRYYGAFQHFCIFGKHHIHGAAIPGDGLAGITDAGDLQLVALLDARESKGTVQLGNGTVVGSCNLHCCTDDGLTGSIFHSTFDGVLGKGTKAHCHKSQRHGNS